MRDSFQQPVVICSGTHIYMFLCVSAFAILGQEHMTGPVSRQIGALLFHIKGESGFSPP